MVERVIRYSRDDGERYSFQIDVSPVRELGGVWRATIQRIIGDPVEYEAHHQSTGREAALAAAERHLDDRFPDTEWAKDCDPADV